MPFGRKFQASSTVTDAMGFGVLSFRWAYKNTKKGKPLRKLMVWSVQAGAWLYVHHKWQTMKVVKIPWQVVAVVLLGPN